MKQQRVSGKAAATSLVSPMLRSSDLNSSELLGSVMAHWCDGERSDVQGGNTVSCVEDMSASFLWSVAAVTVTVSE